MNFGNSSYFGRVEVLYNGLWGTVCDRFWDLQDAGVVCRLLGYDGAVAESSDASFGQGTGQIWLSYVGCVGNEKSISECNHNGWGVQNCGHSDDAGVHCKPRGKVKLMESSVNEETELNKLSFDLRIKKTLLERLSI